MNIAGKPVLQGNELWHIGFRQWVKVVSTSPSTIVELTGANGEKSKFVVTEGGNIAGRRQLYWHQPLVLDLPDRDVSAYQTFVDALKHVLRK